MLVGGGSLLLLAGLTIGIVMLARGKSGPDKKDLVLYKVKYGRLELNIIERGALESAHNSEVFCRVKTGTAKPPAIKYLIDDGSEVDSDRPPQEARQIYTWDEAAGAYVSNKGQSENGPIVVEIEDKETGKKHFADLLVDLEDSALQDTIKSQKITRDTADKNHFTAEEALKFQISQNTSDMNAAERKLEDSRFALMKYTGMSRDEILKPTVIDKLKADMAKLSSDYGRDALKIAEEDLIKFKSGDYLALVKDCMGQMENAKSDLSQQEDREAWAYRMAKKGYQTASQAQAETLRKESYKLTLNKVSLNLENIVKSQKLKDLNTFIGDVEEAKLALERTRTQTKSMEAQKKKDRDIQKSIWEQEQAHYKDILDEIKKCKICAPHDGMVVYYIPDQARYGGGSQQSTVAQGEPVREGQKLMQIPDLKHMLVNTKVHEALVSRVRPGQKASVRVDSFGGSALRGEVESVATLAAQQDFFSSDVKVYPTRITINTDDIEGYDLKPGMSAQVTITVADALEHVLTVPIQALIGSSEMGDDRTIVVMTPEGPRERKVTVGQFNEKFAEVTKGLQEGDEVVENPKVVLGDKIKIHEPAADKTKGDGGKAKKGKGGGPPKGKSPPDAKQ